MILKYGKDSFDTFVLYTYNDYDVCYWYEQVLIKQHRKNPKCLNGTYIDPDSGKRKFSGYGLTSEALKVRGQKISAAKKGKSNGHLGFKHSEKTKKNMKVAQQNNFYILSEESREKMKKPKSEEHKQKMRNRPPPSEETKKKMGSGTRGKPWSKTRRLAYNKRNNHAQSV